MNSASISCANVRSGRRDQVSWISENAMYGFSRGCGRPHEAPVLEPASTSERGAIWLSNSALLTASQERLPALAEELLRIGVLLIVTNGPSMTGVARQVTDRVPVVMMGGSDPVAAGWAVSLARPGGNVTGTANPSGYFAKGVQLLSAVAPATRCLAAFMNLSIEGEDRLRDTLATAAEQLGLQFLVLDVRTDAGIDPAFEEARVWGVDAVLIRNLPR
jgi:hypothetical protein